VNFCSPVLCPLLVQIGPGILKQVAEAYRKLRGTLRWVCQDLKVCRLSSSKVVLLQVGSTVVLLKAAVHAAFTAACQLLHVGSSNLFHHCSAWQCN
jgi:hypothetical protein